MQCTPPPNRYDPLLDAADVLAVQAGQSSALSHPSLSLPILTRSASLLTLLLQEGTVDLELASSVIALDPGLAFGTLQLANREPNPENDNQAIWQFPLAVVAAGRERLLKWVESAPRIESSFAIGCSSHLRQLCLSAVVRGSVAQMLAAKLAGANPQKSFLAGLLFEVARLQETAFSSFPHPLSESVSHGVLPDDVIAAMATGRGRRRNGPPGPVAACVQITNELLAIRGGETGLQQLDALAGSPLWQGYNQANRSERTGWLSHGQEMAKWATANLPRLAPWDFLARLQRRKLWE